MLSRQLPPVTLLTGPRGVGKWTLTRYLTEHHGVHPVDQLSCPTPLTVDTSRAVITFLRRAPFGTVKTVSARLDGASDPSLQALLKTLEEPPPTVRFLLTTVTPPLRTLRSRAQVFTLGLLTKTQVRDILVQQGMSTAAATRAAQTCRGQLPFAPGAGGAQLSVTMLARALATANRTLFDQSLRGFDSAGRDLLHIWLREMMTRQWSVFTEADSFGLHEDRARLTAMAVALTRVGAAAPRLGVRAALEPFLDTP